MEGETAPAPEEPGGRSCLEMRQGMGLPGALHLTLGPRCGEVGVFLAEHALMGAPNGECGGETEGTVSLRAEVPETLLEAMRVFIDHHPHWDQYRLFQAALAGFLVQHGSQDRAVTRCYLANLFPGHRSFEGATAARSRSQRPLRSSREVA